MLLLSTTQIILGLKSNDLSCHALFFDYLLATANFVCSIAFILCSLNCFINGLVEDSKENQIERGGLNMRSLFPTPIPPTSQQFIWSFARLENYPIYLVSLHNFGNWTNWCMWYLNAGKRRSCRCQLGCILLYVMHRACSKLDMMVSLLWAMVAGAQYCWRNSGEAWCCERNWEKAAWLTSGISIAT